MHDGQIEQAYSHQQLASYGLLRMPLALIELPLFLFLPSLYAGAHGLSLSVLSFVLFATRLIDAVLDPIIGGLVAKHRHHWAYARWILCAAPVLGLGFFILLSPRPDSAPVIGSLLIGSIFTFLAYSVMSIAYQAWGADISRTDSEATKIAGIREGFGLVGVILASSLLQIETIGFLLLLFAILLTFACVSLRWAPALTVRSISSPTGSAWSALAQLRQDKRFWRLMWVFLLNGIATAIPATLVIFFIEDVIGAKPMVPVYLLAYFVAGTIGLPAWIWACKRIGLEATWLLGMALAVIAFAWAVVLGPGDRLQFLLVCIMTGLALGADLALPPALLAAVIKASGRAQSAEASYFGVWSFAVKFNLAMAALISLPLVQWGGYQPGKPRLTLALSLVYAVLPCVLKVLAGLLLWRRPVTRVS
jgi:glycoside/pentoside/hexuronide:cation symporter, GPH family